MTVRYRRSPAAASGGEIGASAADAIPGGIESAAVGDAIAGTTAIEEPSNAGIARNSLRRWPSRRPSFSRSWSVRSGRTLRSTALSRNTVSY